MKTGNNIFSCDIVVVGSGVSGLSAAVQAAQLGKKVIIMESCARAGGNWDVTYGMMAVDSPQAKKQGIKVDMKTLINQEIRIFNYQVDSKLWEDLTEASGDNVAWLMENGVQFVEELAPYTVADLNAPLFHAWVVGTAPSKAMLASFEKAGGVLLLNTKGESLIMDNGRVRGITATTKESEKIQIDCSAVICAGGGYIKNIEMVSKVIGRNDFTCRAIADTDGSTLNMCIDVGAKSLIGHENLIGDVVPRYLLPLKHWIKYIRSRPTAHPIYISVNQDAERYVDESCGRKIFAYALSAAFSQEKSFTIFDEEKLKTVDKIVDCGLYKIITDSVANNEHGIYKADTLEELAQKLGLDKSKLVETVKKYNDSCKEGVDKDFEKTPEYLEAFENGPYYAWEDGYSLINSIEGIDYNRKMEVLTPLRKAIPGLYVAGVDGGKLWRDYYSLVIPGSCNANNVYSGRRAAQEASKYIDKK